MKNIFKTEFKNKSKKIYTEVFRTKNFMYCNHNVQNKLCLYIKEIFLL